MHNNVNYTHDVKATACIFLFSLKRWNHLDGTLTWNNMKGFCFFLILSHYSVIGVYKFSEWGNEILWKGWIVLWQQQMYVFGYPL